MSLDSEVLEAIDVFLEQGLIASVLFEIKSGKEATVYCCESRNCTSELLAAKVYRPLESRRFRNDAVYHTGRMHVARAGRVRRAVEGKSAFGRKVQYATWLDHEWVMLNALHCAGADVPKPLARSARAILMPYFGDANAPAPNLNDAELPSQQVAAVVDQLLGNIALMLDSHCVHADLSPYNVLYWNGRMVIIDLPQAVDPRLNPAAHSLLVRDVRNVCEWAARRGVVRDAQRITRDLWEQFTLGQIG
jgi:RIO kinase 1